MTTFVLPFWCFLGVSSFGKGEDLCMIVMKKILTLQFKQFIDRQMNK